MQKPNNDDLEKEVTIKLKKWQVPYLLGAVRLGIWNEDWCAGLVQTGINTYDTHSARWVGRVVFVIEQIKTQTGITQEETEHGCKEVLSFIQKKIDEECIKNEKASQKREAEEISQIR